MLKENFFKSFWKLLSSLGYFQSAFWDFHPNIIKFTKKFNFTRVLNSILIESNDIKKYCDDKCKFGIKTLIYTIFF